MMPCSLYYTPPHETLPHRQRADVYRALGPGKSIIMLIAILVAIVLLIIGILTLKAIFAVIVTLLIGLIIGLIARAIVPGTHGMSYLSTALYGVAGSFLGGIIAHGAAHNSWAIRVILDIVIAAIIIAIVSAITGPRDSGPATLDA